MFKTLFKFALIIVISIGFAGTSSFVGAKTTTSGDISSCDCFCKTENGAEKKTAVAGIEECRNLCKGPGISTLGCYNQDQVDNRPENNKMCWTAAACSSDRRPVEDNAEPEPSVWGGQENFCLPGQGYCYNPSGYIPDFGGSTKVTLGVPIGSLKKSGNLGEYINAVYDFLLGAGALIAIVMIMVAGVEWMLARGRENEISKAKQRINSVIIGLTLLFFAVTLGTLIDPSVVKFKNLGVPKIREMDYVDKSLGCTALSERKDVIFTITMESQALCGKKGVITSIVSANGDELQGSDGFVVGDTCTYFECPGKTEECLQDTEHNYACYTCGEIGYRTTDVPPKPSQSTCAALSNLEVKDGVKSSCHYFNASVLSSVPIDRCVEVYYKHADNGLDCNILKAEHGDEGCSAYTYLGTRANKFTTRNLSGITTSELSTQFGFLYWYVPTDFVNHEEYKKLFDSVCGKDVCNIAKDAGGSCATKELTVNDLENGYIKVTALGIFGPDKFVAFDCQNVGFTSGAPSSNMSKATDAAQKLISPTP